MIESLAKFSPDGTYDSMIMMVLQVATQRNGSLVVFKLTLWLSLVVSFPFMFTININTEYYIYLPYQLLML